MRTGTANAARSASTATLVEEYGCVSPPKLSAAGLAAADAAGVPATTSAIANAAIPEHPVASTIAAHADIGPSPC
jgi:hypothetical protein